MKTKKKNSKPQARPAQQTHTAQTTNKAEKIEAGHLEVSVVMPCLNEQKTIAICVKKAMKALHENNISGEVVVSDNGSTDRSVEIAEEAGARVVHESKKGYGNAYMKGLEEARGKYIVMADSDDTYNFLDIPRFVIPLRQGYDFVMGNRLKGKILPGAMPPLHRYIGNPILSWILRMMFHTKISDSHCGMRGFTKEAFKKMHLQTTGMEFASEMVINAARAKLKTKEIPITYYPRKGESKLHSFRDGWRHLSFMLINSPTHLFFLPGLFAIIIGLIIDATVMSKIFYPTLGPISIILGTLLILLGYQICILGAFAKTYLVTNNFVKPTRFAQFLIDTVTVERGIVTGFILCLIGFIFDAYILIHWINIGMKNLTNNDIQIALVSLTLIIIGAQTIFASFLLNILKIKRRTQ